MFKSGLRVNGALILSDEGVVQGSACSPVIANIFAHEVIDKWIETTVKKHCAGGSQNVQVRRLHGDFLPVQQRRRTHQNSLV